MEILDLLFGIIEKFVPIPQKQFLQLQQEAKDWRVNIQPNDKGVARDKSKIGQLYVKLHEKWIVRLAFAVFYLPLVNMLMSMHSPEIDNEALEGMM